MLVLTRKQGQKIGLTGGIVVTVVDVKPGRVVLGFECPPEVEVLREELATRLASAAPDFVGSVVDDFTDKRKRKGARRGK